MDSLVDRGPGHPHHLSDLRTREILPCVEPHNLSIGGLESPHRLGDFPAFGPLDHKVDWIGWWWHSKVGQSLVEAAAAMEGAGLVEQDSAGDPIDAEESLGWWRNLVEPTPHHQKYLGASVLCVCTRNPPQTIGKHLKTMLIPDRLEARPLV
jgi:hypothetical protein